MTTSKTAGARFYIGPVVDPDEIEAMSDTAALAFFDTIPSVDWTEVEEVESFGDLGDNTEVATFSSVKDRRERKFKTVRDAGTLSLVCGRDALDEGQAALAAAEKTDFNYAFKLVYPTDENQTYTIDYFGGAVLSRPTNLGSVGDITKRTFNVGVNTTIVTAARDAFDWPLNDPDVFADLEFTVGQKLYSGSLGVVTPSQAITVTWPSGGHVFDADGRLQAISPNAAPIGNGRGLWSEALGAARISFNNALSNAAWTKTNLTATQDYPSVFSDDSAPGWRITATADGGTITHTANPVAISASTTMCLPHAMFYWDGTPLTGAIEITQDGFVVATDIRDQLIENRWVQIAGDPQLIADLPDPNVFGIRIAKSGDSIGFCLANIERNYTVTTPILTPSNTTVNRDNITITLNTANFPTLAGVQRFTVLAVVEPRMYPLPPVADPDKPRLGFTTLEINNPYIVTGTGVGDLAPYGGAGEGSLMTVDSVSDGAFGVGNRMLVGTGVGSFTEIVEQETGPTGGAGTYHVNSTQPPYMDGQTTPADIVLQSRLKDAMGYGLNSDIKEDLDYVQKIGLTITVEESDVNTGFDPPNVFFVYNEPNAEGFSVDAPALQSTVALKGDIEHANPAHLTAAPVLNSDYIFTIGAQYLGGTLQAGGPLDGVIQRIIIIGRKFSGEELSAATLALQAKYTT